MKDYNFYTFRGYSIKNEEQLSPSMEDYIEMIYRISCDNEIVRVNDLSNALNVQPPSTTRMIKKLSQAGFVNYEKYGTVKLTTKGSDVGEFLLFRHKTVYNFLKLLCINDNLLEQTEKIEHAVSEEMLKNMNKFIGFFEDNKEVKKKFIEFSKSEI